MQYKLNFDLLFACLELGKLLKPPVQISGGLLHRMYKIETELRVYAVKALNPEIMLRPTAFNNFITSEKIARTAKENGFPAITAMEVNGNIIHNVDGQNYLVFPWAEGTPAKPEAIVPQHCKTIGKMLAQLHAIDFSALNLANNITNTLHNIDWQEYADEAEVRHLKWANLLKENMDKLYKWCEQVNPNSTYISENMVISHRDFDPKNILWSQNQTFVIDWESAGFTNPLLELIETACNWAGYNELDINKEKFLSIIRSYTEAGKIPKNTDWQAILENNFSGKMEWLEYNIHRSLQLKCTDEEEQALGLQETLQTLSRITYYAEMIPTIEKWLKQL